MDELEAKRAREYFADIPERNTGDVLLRTAQQHHVALSAMADTKANIIITVSSIVLTLSIGKLTDPDLRLSVLTLCVFTLLALLLAILAVLPKYRPLGLTSKEFPPGFNLFFMGHFSELTREQFFAEVAQSMRPNGSVYAALANDIYSLGTYLSKYKYRYLRMSYLSFLTGFIVAMLEQIWRIAFH